MSADEKGTIVLKDQAEREILTIEDLANYLGCQPSTIYRLADKRQLHGLRLEGRWLFKTDEFNQGYFLAAPGRAKKSGSA